MSIVHESVLIDDDEKNEILCLVRIEMAQRNMTTEIE
jgi:hypothetical protein